MRYFSLQTVSVIYRVLGVTAAATSLVLFFYFEVGAVQGLNELARRGVVVTTEAYAAAMSVPVLFFIAGLFVSLTTYASGAFIGLMIDIANGVNNIEWWFNQRGFDIRSGDSPLAPHAPRYEPPSKGRSY